MSETGWRLLCAFTAGINAAALASRLTSGEYGDAAVSFVGLIAAGLLMLPPSQRKGTDSAGP